MSINGKHNRVVGRCLVLLYDCQQLGGFPNGLNLTQLQIGAGLNGGYLVHKVSKWRDWHYVEGKPIVMKQGFVRWHYKIASQGIRFVDSLPDEVKADIRKELRPHVGNIPDVPLPRIKAL
jgi:hypothetical protein